MDVHIGREQITSRKDFFVRYLLVAAGIVTAWALNQWNDARQNRQLADSARAAVRAELQRNLSELRSTAAKGDDSNRHVAGLISSLMEAVNAKAPESRIKALIGDAPLSMGIGFPSFERSAWEAAIAGQATRHMPLEEVRVFSQAYASMADLHGTVIAWTPGSMDFAHKAVAWGVNQRLGRTDAVALIQILAQWRHSTQMLQAAGREVANAIDIALAWPMPVPVPMPTAASAPSVAAAAGSAPAASAAAAR
jgi:hypothetical protein